MEGRREEVEGEIVEMVYEKWVEKGIWVCCGEIFWRMRKVKV